MVRHESVNRVDPVLTKILGYKEKGMVDYTYVNKIISEPKGTAPSSDCDCDQEPDEERFCLLKYLFL